MAVFAWMCVCLAAAGRGMGTDADSCAQTAAPGQTAVADSARRLGMKRTLPGIFTGTPRLGMPMRYPAVVHSRRIVRPYTGRPVFAMQASAALFGPPNGPRLRIPVPMPYGTLPAVGAAPAWILRPTTGVSDSDTLQAPSRTPDVVYVPTPQAVVDKMLEMAEVKPGDVVYDLGCGDGRIVVTAAKKYGVKAVGFDINPVRVRESIENVKAANVGHLVTIRQADIFTLDLREASVVTLYLLSSLNVKLMPQLEKLKSGSRIVSHDFDMRGAKPVEVYDLTIEGHGFDADAVFDNGHTIYKWIVPWEKETPEF